MTWKQQLSRAEAGTGFLIDQIKQLRNEAVNCDMSWVDLAVPELELIACQLDVTRAKLGSLPTPGHVGSLPRTKAADEPGDVTQGAKQSDDHGLDVARYGVARISVGRFSLTDPYLGPKLREARKARGKTITLVAKAAGISQPSLSDIERGNRKPKYSTLQRICGELESVS